MATVQQDYGVTSNTVPAQETLFAGGEVGDNVEENIVIVSGEAAMLKGTVLGIVTASGKFKKWTSGASDGSEVARSILAVDVPAASGGDVKAVAYATGQFNQAYSVIAAQSLNAAAVASLRANNIYLKKVYL